MGVAVLIAPGVEGQLGGNKVELLSPPCALGAGQLYGLTAPLWNLSFKTQQSVALL